MSVEQPEGLDVEVLRQRPTVVTALPLKPPARDRLAALLDARVVDIREPVDRVDLVLTPSCSPQLIGALKRKYDGARVIVVELDDWEFDVSVPGPVKRLLDGGVDAYVLADSIEELAQKLGSRAGQSTTEVEPVAARELPSTSTVDEVIAAFLRESVEYSTRLHAEERRHS
ncbi:MAG: hypothetical protein LH616_16495 [Ilumatobacteraceae bacterium]|nr:hypothetical protein [Ilumatobacteraceae bacterium]